MPHQCVHCSKIYPNASKELLEGCSCGSHFFFFMSDNAFQNATIRDEMSSIKGQVDPNSENVSFERQRERGSQKPSSPLAIELTQEEKKEIEKEVREIMGIHDDETPVILDVESIRVLGPGKFELDIINLFNKKRPLIYKLEEGKYIIDLASSMKMNS